MNEDPEWIRVFHSLGVPHAKRNKDYYTEFLLRIQIKFFLCLN